VGRIPEGLCLLVMVLLAGCGDHALPDRTWTASLTVYVRDADTHQPISNAFVTFANDDIELSPPGYTGNSGRATYTIEILKGHAVRLDVHSVEHEGWLPWPTAGEAPVGATLNEDHPTEEVEIELVTRAGGA